MEGVVILIAVVAVAVVLSRGLVRRPQGRRDRDGGGSGEHFGGLTGEGGRTSRRDSDDRSDPDADGDGGDGGD
jgi:hypothetical protein